MHPYDAHTIAQLRARDLHREASRMRATTISRAPAFDGIRRALGNRMIVIGHRLAASNAQAQFFHQR